MTLKHELASVGFPYDESRLDAVCRFLQNHDIDRLSDLAGFPKACSLSGVGELNVVERAFIDKVSTEVEHFMCHLFARVFECWR